MTDKITKRIANFEVEVLPYIMGNLAQGFEAVEYDAATNTITATGTPRFWEMISLPTNVTLTVVE